MSDASSDRLLIWLTTNPVMTFLIRNIASRIDPLIFKASNGRFSSMGPPSMPMLTITAIGRHSGEPRSVHLAAIPDGDDFLIVASAMGQQQHPAWRYNLEANPEIEVQITGESYKARAQVLSDAEKEQVWDRIRQTIPQIHVYEGRTSRNIRVFRLSRAG